MPEDRGSKFEDRNVAPPPLPPRPSTLDPRTSRSAIEVSRVSKIYRRYSHRKQFATLKSALLSRSLVRDLKPDETFTALNDISLTVPRGRTLGVIGRNGSGKSTLLKLVAGITKPSNGTVKVHGRISALIELGAGFHPEISGRENVFINGIMLGLTKREVTERFDEIVEFAEMKDFIDAPVKTYSSGMYMRLGFAVAIHVDPDVLLVDEVLAVGDEGFTHKCLDKFAEFKRRGKTILLVTHSLGLVERFCDEAVWLDAGRIKGSGDPKRIVGAYITDVAGKRWSSPRRTRGPGRRRRRPLFRPTSPHQPSCRTTRWRLRPAPRTCSGRRRGAGDRARSRSPRSRLAGPTGRQDTSSTPASVSTSGSACTRRCRLTTLS
jgi:ABC-type polysaccharide/polyol phosphate transport system ATPase subunit